MSRCDICDYTEDEGSPLLNTPPSKYITVRWNSSHDGFLCTNCRTAVKGAKYKDDYEAEILELLPDA